MILHFIDWQISLLDCLFFSRFWSICVLKLFFNLVVKLSIFKSTLSFRSNRFSTWLKIQDKSLNISRTKRAFKMKWKAFYIIFHQLSVAKNSLKREIVPLIMTSMLSIFDCIKYSSSLSMEEIELFAIVNWISHVSDFLRIFMDSFKQGLILLRYSSTDIVLFRSLSLSYSI